MAVGVVLSGGDGDGTLGIKAIKERGGLILAQVSNGYGPQHAETPDSAISTGFVDFAVLADKMGQLAEFARSVNLSTTWRHHLARLRTATCSRGSDKTSALS